MSSVDEIRLSDAMSCTDEIRRLAARYETAEFLNGDPSWFMHQVAGAENQETMAFLASCFSYGSRRQFMPKIQRLLDDSGGEIHEWVRGGRHKEAVPADDRCFYRLYTNAMVRELLDRMMACYGEYGSLKGLMRESFAEDKCNALSAIEVLVRTFGGKIVPRSTQSSCKRLCMFLRWMVRDNSPVDLGLWSDLIDKRTLIMPLDTHVMQQANRLGLISTRTTSMATARRLTERMKEIFPDDPLKGDFALFGLGVNNINKD